MRNQKKSGFRKLSGMNKVSLNADKHEGRFMNRAMKSMPWLICASAAWLTLVPCEMAFAADPPVPNDKNVLYNKIGVDTGGMVDGGQLDINNSVASEAVSKSKWYLTSNWAKLGDATNGHTTIQSGVTIGNNSNPNNEWYVHGSLASNGTAANSSVTATNVIVYGDIIGGDGHKGASGNNVEITDTIVSRIIYGGRVQDNVGENDASFSNNVSMNAGSSADEVWGGFALYGNIHNNTVVIDDSKVLSYCGGGYTISGIAIDNTIELKNKSSADTVFGGGYYYQSGDVIHNIVTLSDSNVTKVVHGGITYSGKVEYNEVHLKNSSASTIFGGGYYYLQNGDVLNNIVTLEDSKANSVYGGYTPNGNADGNSVTVTGSDSSISFAVYGGWGTTGASGNKVTLDKVTVSGNVGGGKTDSGAASGNEVSLSNETTFKGDLYAGYTDDGDAIGNILELTNISQEVYDIYSSFTKTGQAGGEVTLTNSQVDNVYGGKTEKGAANGSKVIGKGDTTTIGGRRLRRSGNHRCFFQHGGSEQC